MDSNFVRMVSTAVIWTAVTVMAVAALVNNAVVDFWTLALFVGAGVAATVVVWLAGQQPPPRVSVEQAAKAKRRGRVERLLEDLDDAELDELRQRLGAGDGELLGLGDLLAEQERRARKR